VLDPERLSRRIVAAIDPRPRQLATAATTAPKDPAALNEAAQAYMRDLAGGKVRPLPESVRSASVAGMTGERRQRLADLLLAQAPAPMRNPGGRSRRRWLRRPAQRRRRRPLRYCSRGSSRRWMLLASPAQARSTD
jgi:hypothetical protein